MQDRDAFLGLWRLDPTESNYSQGEPPASATYDIASTSTGYRFTARWTKADGSTNEVSFEGVADGEAHPVEAGYADALMTIRVDDRRLDTKGGATRKGWSERKDDMR